MIEGTFLLWILIIAVFARLEEKDRLESIEYWRDQYFSVSAEFLKAAEVVREQEKQLAYLKGDADE